MAEEGCEPETALPAAMNTSAVCKQPFIGLDYFLGRRTWEVSTANLLFFFLRCLCLSMRAPAHQRFRVCTWPCLRPCSNKMGKTDVRY